MFLAGKDMMSKKIIPIFILALFMFTNELMAEETSERPELLFQPITHILSGYMNDGTIIGHGRVKTSASGKDIVVWCGSIAPITHSMGGACKIWGENDHQHILQVRLESDSARFGSSQGQSITLAGDGGYSLFNIVTVGDQYISTDRYSFLINSKLLE